MAMKSMTLWTIIASWCSSSFITSDQGARYNSSLLTLDSMLNFPYLLFMISPGISDESDLKPTSSASRTQIFDLKRHPHATIQFISHQSLLNSLPFFLFLLCRGTSVWFVIHYFGWNLLLLILNHQVSFGVIFFF